MRKYHNNPIRIDGMKFDSGAEFRRYNELVLLEKAGAISGLMVHPSYVLMDKCRLASGRLLRATNYEADFSYLENGNHVVEDVKGFSTEAFKLKAKLFQSRYPEIDFRIIPA